MHFVEGMETTFTVTISDGDRYVRPLTFTVTATAVPGYPYSPRLTVNGRTLDEYIARHRDDVTSPAICDACYDLARRVDEQSGCDECVDRVVETIDDFAAMALAAVAARILPV